MLFYLASIGCRTFPWCSKGVGMLCVPPAFPCSSSRIGFGKGTFVPLVSKSLWLRSPPRWQRQAEGGTRTCCFFLQQCLAGGEARVTFGTGGSAGCRGRAAPGKDNSIIRRTRHLPSIAFFFSQGTAPKLGEHMVFFLFVNSLASFSV